MQGRTFFRIMVDNLFVNNPIVKAISTLMKFCNNSVMYDKKNLKFLKKVPLNNTEPVLKYNKKFVFDSSKVCGVNSR